MNANSFVKFRKVLTWTLLSVCTHTEYVAMYTYESTEQGDLSFQQGDIVMVTRKEGDWWTGTIGGRTGVFPSNYVKPRDSASEVTFCSWPMTTDGSSWWICSNCYLCLVFQSLGQAGKTGSLGKKPGELHGDVAPLQLLLCTSHRWKRFDSVEQKCCPSLHQRSLRLSPPTVQQEQSS